MRQLKLICIALLVAMVTLQSIAQSNHKKIINLKKEWKTQTRAPQNISLQAFLTESQQLEIQCQNNICLTMHIYNSQNETILTSIICLNLSQPSIVDLKNLPKGEYILYLHNDNIEAEGSFYLN